MNGRATTQGVSKAYAVFSLYYCKNPDEIPAGHESALHRLLGGFKTILLRGCRALWCIHMNMYEVYFVQ